MRGYDALHGAAGIPRRKRRAIKRDRERERKQRAELSQSPTTESSASARLGREHIRVRDVHSPARPDRVRKEGK
jgi:hypothetical protein